MKIECIEIERLPLLRRIVNVLSKLQEWYDGECITDWGTYIKTLNRLLLYLCIKSARLTVELLRKNHLNSKGITCLQLAGHERNAIISPATIEEINSMASQALILFMTREQYSVKSTQCIR